MSWKSYYEKHLMTAQQAVSLIQSGDVISVGHAVGEPTALLNALVADAERLHDVELLHMVLMGKGEYLAESMEGHFRHNSLFVGGAARKAVEQGRADFTPCYFHRVPELLRTAHRPDVAMIMVSPPDEEGNCSLGVSVDYTISGSLAAGRVIAQVNRHMPRCHGDCFLHVTDLTAIVEHDQPLIELQPAVIGETERAIGEYCASLIHDGDCLQLGIGALPDAVLNCLGCKNDLGLHTEMFSDGAVDLIRAGNINGRRKTLHTGKHVATFLMGTRKLYDFVNDNPSIYMAPVDYVNNPLIIAQNDNLVSINSCVQIDLSGQVCSESVGLRQISAVGGQVDFIRGAALSRGGPQPARTTLRCNAATSTPARRRWLNRALPVKTAAPCALTGSATRQPISPSCFSAAPPANGSSFTNRIPDISPGMGTHPGADACKNTLGGIAPKVFLPPSQVEQERVRQKI